MKLSRGLAVVAMSALALAGCRLPWVGAGKAPTGQVVATVGGQEITVRELNAELAGVNLPDPKTRKLAEQAALRNIIARTILAKAAVDQGVDKTPDFALQKQRAMQGLLVQTLQNKVVASVPPATRDEAEAFVAAHPDIFAERKVFVVNQIRSARPADAAAMQAFEPLKTMEEVAAQLDKDHLAYQKGVANFDAVGADPKMVDAIVKLPPNEIFIIPNGDGLIFNQIQQTQVVPFTGEPAIQYALKVITRERTQDALNRQFSEILAKAKGQVVFNKDYAPPKTATPAPTSKPS